MTIVGVRHFGVCAQQFQHFLLHLQQPRDVLLRRVIGFIDDVQHLGSQVGFAHIHLHNLEALAAFGDDVHAAVFVLLGDGDDLRRAAYLLDPAAGGAHHAEGLARFQKVANHLLVAGLEDVQRQGCVGKQDDVEREQGKQFAHAQIVAPLV